MKRLTDDLLKSLKNKHSVEDYFSENDSEMNFDTLSELLENYRVRKNISKAEVARRSNLNREYCYELLRGKTGKNPSRDKVIMLCFGIGLSFEEFQQVLKIGGYAPLYARNSRDAIIIFSIYNNLSVIETNIKLDEYNLEHL